MRSLRRTVLAGIALAVGATLTLAGCSSGGVLSSGSSSGSKKETTIGVSYPTSDSTFFTQYVKFVKQGASQLGVKINAVAANNSDQQQVSDVQNLISQGVGGLVITPNSTAVAPQLLKLASDAHIKTVVVDRYPGYAPGKRASGGYVGFIGPNDEKVGEDIASDLNSLGATKLLAVGGPQGTSVAQGRQQGLENEVKKDGATLVQYQATDATQTGGLNAFENMLQAHPAGTVDGVWCYNDDVCMGAIKAAQNAGRASQMKFVGMDLTPQGLQDVGNGSYAASFGGHFLEAGFGLVMLYDDLHGKAPKHPTVKLDLLKIDKSNLASFQKQYIDNPPPYDFKQLSQVYNPKATGEYTINLK